MPVLLEKIETPEEMKTHRNAEYLAMLERSFRQADDGDVVTMTFKEWEKIFCDA